MLVAKPQKLSLLHRTIEHDHRFHFAVGVILYFPLDYPRTLLSEAGLWKLVPRVLGKEPILDEMVAKARGEFLVAGSAFAPGGVPTKVCGVKVRVGAVEKSLAAIGDRYWDRGVPTPPALFTEMPITWENAFGGKGFALNPKGKGFDIVETPDGKRQWMPNIELPKKLIRSPSDKPTPAGYGTIELTSPLRTAKAGTYDSRYLNDQFPGLASDVDWTLFNLAHEDQWVPEFFQGGESWLIENMHPTRPRMEGKLPNAIARVHVTQRIGTRDEFREVPMRLETVWLFPHHERGALIFRGVLSVTEDDAADLVHLIAAFEDPAAPRTTEYYKDILTQRLDKKRGAVKALRDWDLLPDWPPEVEVTELQSDMGAIRGEELLRKNNRKRAVRQIEAARAFIASVGLDPDEHGPKLPAPDEAAPTIDQLPDMIEKVQAENAVRLAEAMRMKELEDVKIRALCASTGMDFAALEKERLSGPAGPPTFQAARKLEVLGEIAARARANGVVLQDIEEMLRDPVLHKRYEDSQRKLMEGYKQTAHLQEAAPRKTEAESAGMRAAAAQAVAQGIGLVGVNLTGVDLRGISLAGADLRSALMECADLTGVDLSGADLREAVLARANLTDANLTGAQLKRANLGGAIAHRTNLVGADLAGAILTKADLTGANLQGATIERADVMEALFAGATLTGARCAKLTFYRTKLLGMNCAGADFTGANFIEADLSGADLTGAMLEGVTFVTTIASKACFARARMHNARVQIGCRFDGTTFFAATVDKTNFRGTNLEAADFNEANVRGSDFSECNLRGAKFVRADARGARFVRADLTDADMSAIDLMDAVAQKSTIEGTNLRLANLYQADMARVKTSATTVTMGANLKKVRVNPVRKQT